uniref:UDP-glucuronosyltransferase n=1 Tax=Octopus bimaculoides TaxID=37653 RepID=A0A0L8FFI2_OCTBM|eukprot:XP_014790295.1 PREDICTED: 2-hydroxyacylsphingosine 1-beta-galactosyltransferase-like [Octopus bimaculoides]
MTMMWKILFSSILLLAFLNKNEVAEADNILLLSWPLFSHVQSLASMGRELSKLSHTSYLPITEDLVEHFKTYKGVKIMHMKNDPNLLTFIEMGMQLLYKNSNITFKQLQETMDAICDNLLLDEDWFQSLKAINATIAVVDYVFMSNCLAIIPYRLSIPYVFQGLNFEHCAISRTPWLPSTFPHQALINSDQMNFYDRLENSFVTMSTYFKRLNGAPLKSVKTYAPEKPDITFTSLMQQADLYLIETDTVLDYPFPTLPNVISIGGISTRPASALKGDLRKFADESNHGIIVVSFGSFVEELPKKVIAKMELAFQDIKYSVIWKRPDSKQLAPNIFVTKWLPQNDLLGHPKTKLFITHCGNNGQFEALYHGVPMLGFPVFAEQYHNGHRIQIKGYGISMDLFNYSKDELVSNINELIENPKYKAKIKIASEIYRSQPEHPAAKGARYIDHVIKYGGDYLRSSCQTMPLYQYFMLDIYLVIFVIFIILTLIVSIVIRKCYLHFTKKNTKLD